MHESKPLETLEAERSLPLTFLFACEGDECTALCLELDIASCGATIEEAEESLKHLIALYIADCLESGETRIPLRPVTLEALLEFLGPSGQELPLTSRRRSVPIHARA